MKKKTVFVTGASRGIGKSIAISFIENGYNVAVGYKKNKKLAEQISTSENFLPIRVDISQRSSIKNAIKKTEKKFRNIDILINNAGISQEKPFEKITDHDWDKMLQTNLRGIFSFCQEVIPKMKKNKWGRIINIVSIGGQWGGYNQVHYAAAKAGTINLTRSLAKLFSKDGITSNAISPGLVLTDISKREINSKRGMNKIDSIPIGRIATPQEIANVATFLCSENASYITGQTINVNGGMYFD